MNKKAILFLLLLLISAVYGCGKSNLLQGMTKPDENISQIELAQMYLDQGRYTKAEKITRECLNDTDPKNDEDAKLILGQALMGEAELNMAELIKNLSRDVTSNFDMLNFVDLSKRDKVFEAAEYLLSVDTDYLPARLAAGTAAICAAVLKVNTTFNPSGGYLRDSPYVGNPNINAVWVLISPQIRAWTTGGANALADATGDEDLRNSATSINIQIGLISDDVSNAVVVSYADLLNVLDAN